MSLLGVLRAESGLSLADAALLASWTRPAAHTDGEPYAAVWTEVETLGVVAQGALTATGVALRAGDDDALLAACADVLPAATATAVFGSDLTALAVGSPSGRITSVLDACADRESTGGAVTWRLSRSSVRRALDDGWALPDLRLALAEIAGSATLPSAVTVLLDDVERAYGQVVVRAASCVLLAADELVAAELLHDRRLAGLALVAVTPTVLVASTDATRTVASLRKAGHLPRHEAEPAEAAPATVRIGRTRASPVDDPVREQPVTDLRELAERLLTAPRPQPLVPGPFVPAFAEPTGLSQLDEVILHEAVLSSSRVEIVYRDGRGSITERVIRPIAYGGGVLEAWCELRSAEREFVLGRILAVRAV